MKLYDLDNIESLSKVLDYFTSPRVVEGKVTKSDDMLACGFGVSFEDFEALDSVSMESLYLRPMMAAFAEHINGMGIIRTAPLMPLNEDYSALYADGSIPVRLRVFKMDDRYMIAVQILIEKVGSEENDGI